MRQEAAALRRAVFHGRSCLFARGSASGDSSFACCRDTSCAPLMADVPTGLAALQARAARARTHAADPARTQAMIGRIKQAATTRNIGPETRRGTRRLLQCVFSGATPPTSLSTMTCRAITARSHARCALTSAAIRVVTGSIG